MDSNKSIATKIMIVEDQTLVGESLKLLLEVEGYVVEYFHNGYEALDYLREKNDINLILLDIVMPKISGLEVCEIIRDELLLKSLPIIFITGAKGVDDIVNGFKVGANDFVVKPFVNDELLARINNQFNNLISYQKSLEFRKKEAISKIAKTYSHAILKPLSSAIIKLDKIQDSSLEAKEFKARVEYAHNRISAFIYKMNHIKEESELKPKEGSAYIISMEEEYE